MQSCVALRQLRVPIKTAHHTQVTIRELPGGVTLAGAVEREVHSREEMATVLEQGSLCRAVASTNMNNRCAQAVCVQR